MAIATPAAAQIADPASPLQTAQPAPAPAPAGGPVVLDQVTVGGERVTRSIRDTASSVSVFDPAALERKRPGLSSTNDVMERVPNVTATESSNFAPAIRGVDGTGPAQGVNAFVAGTRTRITYTVDGRPLTFNETIFGDLSLWDVERVEVFRGPQSTLQGRNSIAGAVVVKTRDPGFEPEIGGRVMVGNQRQRQYSAVVSTPLVKDQVAMRLAVDYGTYKSFVAFQGFGGVQDPGRYESLNLRGKLLIKPENIEGFQTLLTVTHQRYEGPQTNSVARPFSAHVSSFPLMPVFAPRSTGVIAETKYRISDALNFESTISYADVRVKRLVGRPQDAPATVHSREFLFEPRLRFTAMDGRLKGFFGLYFFHANQDDMLNFFAVNRYDDKTRTLAAYTEVTFRLFKDFDVILGGRLESERRRRVGGEAPTFDTSFKETYNVFLPKVGVAWHATDKVTVGATVSRGYNGGGAGLSFGDANQMPPVLPFTYSFKPEYVWTYEAFARTELFDKRVQVNANIFYSRYRDMQLPFIVAAPFVTEIRNAERAITYGAELTARWLVAPGLELFGEIGLLKTRLTKYPGSGLQGNELPRAPAFTAGAGVSYKHDSGVDVSVDGRYSSAYFSEVSNNPRGRTDPYVVVNAQIGYTWRNARFFAFVNNLFDSGKSVAVFTSGAPATDTAHLLRPRWFGVGAQVTF